MPDSRRKGIEAEKKVARLIQDHLGVHLKRNLVQSRDKGNADLVVDPADLDNPIARTLDQMAIEVKNYRRVGEAEVERWWEEAVVEAEAVEKVPLLIYRGMRQHWRFMTPLHVNNSRDFVYTMTLFVEGWSMLVREVSE